MRNLKLLVMPLAVPLIVMTYLDSGVAFAKPKPKMVAEKIDYPANWFRTVGRTLAEPNEILPQDAKKGEVVVSTRTPLGRLLNPAAAPFSFDSKPYGSVEGFWSSMMYPEGDQDSRAKASGIEWRCPREEVAEMDGETAQKAGELATENMIHAHIKWVSYQGKHLVYRSSRKGEQYKLIFGAMMAKFKQNPELSYLLLSTRGLKLRPDHKMDAGTPPAWRTSDMLMEIREKLSKERLPLSNL